MFYLLFYLIIDDFTKISCYKVLCNGPEMAHFFLCWWPLSPVVQAGQECRVGLTEQYPAGVYKVVVIECQRH